ncbi:LacI family transcriptional regulator [Neobacillus sp. MER 74]|uniref:LacI family DNA-binding transcriptional regulator n=1 Tax=Neobacillus sp. MER 74 TaxID=2939566 RepID=UPI002040AF1B|nr:LacI family DNA-binding transcriptional regulator [Neobacillus sp. MER 74]MCM3113773.1 LacI family transcriptional regulator [Neobacillus sp. MER 74]
MATMKDISKKANVSIATVSAVVNQSTYVSPELTERVNRAIEELNYRPNAIARSLKMKSTNTVGVILSDILNPYYPAIVKGMDDVAIKNNFSVILCNTSNDNNRFQSYLDLMVDKRVDGLILANISNQEELLEVEKRNLNFVLVNRRPLGYNTSYVGVNNQLAIELAVNHLVSLGYKRIAFIGGNSDLSTSKERLRGFIQGKTQNGLQATNDLIFEGEYTQESGYASVIKMLKQVKELPDAICAASDLIAFGIIKALRDKGIRVPEDIAVIGNDNNNFSKDFLVPLSTVNHPTYEMGKLGMELLLQRVNEGENHFPKQVILTPSLIIRESCKSSSKKNHHIIS